MSRVQVRLSKADDSPIAPEEVNDIANRLEAAGVVTAVDYEAGSNVLLHVETETPEEAKERVASALAGDEYTVSEPTEI